MKKILCKECKRLSITEKAQNTFDEKIKPPHVCKKYNRQVFHEDRHPELVRCWECLIRFKFFVRWKKRKMDKLVWNESPAQATIKKQGNKIHFDQLCGRSLRDGSELKKVILDDEKEGE